MTDTINTPTVPAGASIEELLGAITERLRNVAEVVEKEHLWLKPKVEFFRKLDDNDIDYEIAQGYLTEEEAIEKASEDNLVLKRVQVDTHLRNLSLAATYVGEAAEIIQSIFLAEEKEGCA